MPSIVETHYRAYQRNRSRIRSESRRRSKSRRPSKSRKRSRSRRRRAKPQALWTYYSKKSPKALGKAWGKSPRKKKTWPKAPRSKGYREPLMYKGGRRVSKGGKKRGGKKGGKKGYRQAQVDRVMGRARTSPIIRKGYVQVFQAMNNPKYRGGRRVQGRSYRGGRWVY